jgi:hypothetical protein
VEVEGLIHKKQLHFLVAPHGLIRCAWIFVHEVVITNVEQQVVRWSTRLKSALSKLTQYTCVAIFNEPITLEKKF